MKPFIRGFTMACLIPILCAAATSTTPTSADERIRAGVGAVLGELRRPAIPARTIDLREFANRSPDAGGTHDFAAHIERAIAALSAQGGGKLLFTHPQSRSEAGKPVVVYRVRGPIALRSNIELSIEASVKIQFEFDPPSYLVEGRGVLTRYEGTTLYTRSPLIRAFGVHDVAITSAGGVGATPEIDGDGKRWRTWEEEGNRARGGGQHGKIASYLLVRATNQKGGRVADRRFEQEFLRPPLMQFFLCDTVLVEGIKLSNSPFWCVHPVFSERLVFRGITFEALVANNDGFDPESSRYVLIEDITFNNADDNVAIKSGRDVEGRDGADIAGTEIEGFTSPYIRNGRMSGPTEHVLVRNCRFQGHYAMCIGSEISGGAHHIYALDNTSASRVAMALFVKGGRNRGGTVSDVYVRNLQLNEVRRDVICLIPNYDGDTKSAHPTKIDRVYVENVTARQAGSGVRIYGWPDQLISNVRVKNVTIERVDKLPLGINHVKQVVLENVSVGGKSLDGSYDQSDPGEPTPRAG